MSDSDVLDVISRYRAQHGYAPTQREIADELGVTDRAVRKRLNRMAQAGEVVWDPGKRRTLRRTDMKGRRATL